MGHGKGSDAKILEVESLAVGNFSQIIDPAEMGQGGAGGMMQIDRQGVAAGQRADAETMIAMFVGYEQSMKIFGAHTDSLQAAGNLSRR
jgi:hypothetical protein